MSEREKKKEYLKQLKYIRSRKKDVDDRIRKLKIDWKCPGSMSQDGIRSGNGTIRDTSDYTIALEKLEEELRKIEAELCQAEKERLQAINKLPHKYASILEKRYVYRKEWDEIGEELAYEKSNVYELHRKALDMFQIPK